jgi:hypothetical protein
MTEALELFKGLLNTPEEEAKYEPARTVGVAKVVEVYENHEDGFDRVILDIPKLDERDISPEIRRVPYGWFLVGDDAEIITLKFKGAEPPSWQDLVLLDNGGFWLVAIRPYNQETYGDRVDRDDPNIRGMFDVNSRGKKISPGFYRVYLGRT